jgi:DNA topoisomerase-1
LQCIDSVAVNAYLRDITVATFTAKNFRTWAGTAAGGQRRVRFARVHIGCGIQAQRRARDRLGAARLGNTRAVCRGSYIHPGVLEGYRENVTIAAAKQGPRRAGLSVEEAAVLALLKRRARHQRPRKSRRSYFIGP